MVFVLSTVQAEADAKQKFAEAWKAKSGGVGPSGGGASKLKKAVIISKKKKKKEVAAEVEAKAKEAEAGGTVFM